MVPAPIMSGLSRARLVKKHHAGSSIGSSLCRCRLTPTNALVALMMTSAMYIYQEEIVVSLMPALMPAAKAPRRTPERLDKQAVREGLSGYWQRMDVREASGLTSEEFEEHYMKKGMPVVIRNDPGALAITKRLNLTTMLQVCGDKDPELGRRLVDVVRDLTTIIQKELSRRLWETHGITLPRALKIMEGKAHIRTVRDFFKSEYFSTVQTAQDPRFPNAKKDWSHPADYLWPPSIHSWPLQENCPPVMDVLRDVISRAPLGFVPQITAPSPPLDIVDLFLFASGVRRCKLDPNLKAPAFKGST